MVPRSWRAAPSVQPRFSQSTSDGSGGRSTLKGLVPRAGSATLPCCSRRTASLASLKVTKATPAHGGVAPPSAATWVLALASSLASVARAAPRAFSSLASRVAAGVEREPEPLAALSRSASAA